MKPRKQTQLPKAFDKGRYSGISNLDADGWSTQFERRRLIAGVHDYLELDFPPTEFDTTIETLREEMEAVLRNPVCCPASLEQISSKMALWLTPIHSPTIHEFYQIEVKIPRKRRAEAVNEMRRVFSSAGSKRELVSQVVRSPEAVGLVAVNLGLSDSALKADFADWLSSIRLTEPELARRSRNNGPNIQSWVEMGLLPCMDLLLWGRLNGVEMPPRKISDAIHEDPRYKESNVRLTCIPLAKAILDDLPRGRNIMANLEAKWARETVERRTTSLRIEHKRNRRKKLS